MTRINAGIDPRELPDKLLLAEHREITRIPNAVLSGKAKVMLPAPAEFTLGTGHVRFFYTRLSYLWRRYTALFVECQRREFKVTDKTSAFMERASVEFLESVFEDWSPSKRDRELVVGRIESKGFELLPVSDRNFSL